MKKLKFKIKKKHIPALFAAGGFAGGTILTAALLLVMVAYPASDGNSILNATSYAIRISVDSLFNMGRKEAYGRVESIGDNTLTLVATRAGITRMYTLTFDAATKFYAFSNDAEISEIPLKPDDIQLGEQVSVTTTEPIGSKKNQQIASVLVI
jgi:hypothetical protein